MLDLKTSRLAPGDDGGLDIGSEEGERGQHALIGGRGRFSLSIDVLLPVWSHSNVGDDTMGSRKPVDENRIDRNPGQRRPPVRQSHPGPSTAGLDPKREHYLDQCFIRWNDAKAFAR